MHPAHQIPSPTLPARGREKGPRKGEGEITPARPCPQGGGRNHPSATLPARGREKGPRKGEGENYWRRRGSRASRSASPSQLKAKTATLMATPGPSASHGSLFRNRAPVFI